MAATKTKASVQRDMAFLRITFQQGLVHDDPCERRGASSTCRAHEARLGALAA
jgi:hypothetical protein